MMNVIRLRKGFNLNLEGKASDACITHPLPSEIGVVPSAFEGVIPKPLVKEGDEVKAGEPLFANKEYPEVTFASPVSGKILAIIRGERRKILCIKIKPDAEQKYAEFSVGDINHLNGDDVIKLLLSAGLFGFINQLPYAISTNPQTQPKAIFVSAFRDMPLAADFEIELKDNEESFKLGIKALSKISKVYLNIGKHQTNTALVNSEDAQVTQFDGPCPAANVGIQINHLSPINKGEVVWTIDPSFIIILGNFLKTGKVLLQKRIALGGSKLSNPCYVETLIGTPFSELLAKQLKQTEHVRIINGNPLTGVKSDTNDYVGAHTSEITCIPEGDDNHELFGWISPRFNNFSTSRSYFSWLFKNKTYNLDARIKGGKRNMIMSGEYDKVLPMDIYAEYLIKAIIAGNIDRQEELGIYEVSPEDFALAEFVDSSKLPLQQIVREGLNILRKENA